MNLPLGVVKGIVAEATRKHIAKGKPEAVLERVEYFARDLFPRGSLFFSQLFTLGPVTANEAVPPRRLGEMFWDNAGRDRDTLRRIGSFYTPEPVIDRILDLVWNDLFPDQKAMKTVCDPAVGCGFFLLRLIERRAKQAGLAAVRSWAEHCLFGADNDPAAVFMARACLWLALSDRRGEFVPSPDRIRWGDSLLGPAFSETGASSSARAINWGADFPGPAESGGFDCIISNPPYEVLTNFSKHPERAELAAALRESGWYHDSMGGQINLYRCFIERSLALLTEHGTLSLVVPLSLTRDAAALPLRKRLVEQCAAKEWYLYGERDNIFPGVTQSACIFRAVKHGGPAANLRFHSGNATFSIRTKILRRAGPGLCFPSLGTGATKLWLRLWENAATRLGDICAMRVGEVDQTFFRACMADEDTGCVLARGAHLAPFTLDVSPVPGKERFLREDAFLAMKGKAADPTRERANQWRVVQLGIRNLHSRPRLVAALAQPGVYLGNSLNAYFPADGISLEYVAGLLNSALLDWLFRATSGNNNINLHEMRILPVPDSPSPQDISAVEQAYAECARLAAADAKTTQAREQLDQAVLRCYGMDMERDKLRPL